MGRANSTYGHERSLSLEWLPARSMRATLVLTSQGSQVQSLPRPPFFSLNFVSHPGLHGPLSWRVQGVAAHAGALVEPPSRKLPSLTLEPCQRFIVRMGIAITP
jgi:hypothetical protein